MRKQILFTFALIVSRIAFSAEYYVDVSRPDDTGAATSWATAKKTIQAAVDLAVDGDTVWVTNGFYSLSSEITVTNAITVQSVNGSDATIVSGNSSNSCFVLSNACVVGGITIKNGKAPQGGGVNCLSDSSVVSNCVITENYADYGGGISHGIVLNCEICNNSASNNAGGLYYTDVYNSLIYSNYANCIAPAVSHGKVINCTVTENLCGNDVSRLSQVGIVIDNCYVRNSIIFNNFEGNSISASDIAYSCFPGASDANGNIKDYPLFTYDYHISTDSLCRAAGTAEYSAGQDLDELSWLNPPAMGCYEVHAPISMALAGPTNICVGLGADYTVVTIGSIERMTVDFGDGQVLTNCFQFYQTWNNEGSYDVVLLGINADYPQGVSFTQTVFIVNESKIFVSAESGDDTADGKSWASAKAGIQAGIDAAAVGGTVFVTNGVYNISRSIQVRDAVSVIAGNDPSQTIVDAGGSGQVFSMTGSGSLISGMTITGGDHDHFSYLPDVIYGGGVYCDDGDHIITNCIISGNTASYDGGGIYGGSVYNSVISDNQSTWRNGGGTAGSKVYNCIIKGNACETFGGGIFEGLAANCLIKNNYSGGEGGGISQAVAVNCTIISNSAMACAGGAEGSTVKNSIIYNNIRKASFQTPHNISRTFLINSCCPEIVNGVLGNITNSPIFEDEVSENFRLQNNSPCINAGNNNYIIGTTDLSGNSRISGDVVDMGAYEYQDPETDMDADGIADLWEMQNFGSRYSAVPDTICSNRVNTIRQAYIAGLDPKDPDSRFQGRMGMDQVLRWDATSGRVYSVWYSTNLLSGFQCLETNIPWSASCFTNSSNVRNGYYKIDVRLEDDSGDL